LGYRDVRRGPDRCSRGLTRPLLVAVTAPPAGLGLRPGRLRLVRGLGIRHGSGFARWLRLGCWPAAVESWSLWSIFMHRLEV